MAISFFMKVIRSVQITVYGFVYLFMPMFGLLFLFIMLYVYEPLRMIILVSVRYSFFNI